MQCDDQPQAHGLDLAGQEEMPQCVAGLKGGQCEDEEMVESWAHCLQCSLQGRGFLGVLLYRALSSCILSSVTSLPITFFSIFIM